MRFTTAEGEQRYDTVVGVASRTVVGLDFDGTLAPIVDDPAKAHIHPDAAAALVDLASEVAAIAVITGRPARQALDLGGLEEVGDALQAAGKEPVRVRPVRQRAVEARAGAGSWERGRRVGWRPSSGTCHAPCAWPVPTTPSWRTRDSRWRCTRAGCRTPRRPSTGCCRRCGRLARQHGLVLEPGRSVIEVRSAGSHKGLVVDRLAAVLDAQGFVFAGDDLGDVEAFEAVEEPGQSGRRAAAGVLGLGRAERARGGSPTSSSEGRRA
ncbi:trehalose-phosphatase [Nocardioides convexus]|uniref:trehalose-phosphatase n=1 Tax=Nocardioides convexus TaxID=2712224 RepID=UPI002418352F|nr:trehalose-phosphatase [Nocardioides convexus]